MRIRRRVHRWWERVVGWYRWDRGAGCGRLWSAWHAIGRAREGLDPVNGGRTYG